MREQYGWLLQEMRRQCQGIVSGQGNSGVYFDQPATGDRLAAHSIMKTIRTFKGSWFGFAIVAAIVVCEFVAWEVSRVYGLRANPLTVAFLAMGLVAVGASILYHDTDIG